MVGDPIRPQRRPWEAISPYPQEVNPGFQLGRPPGAGSIVENPLERVDYRKALPEALGPQQPLRDEMQRGG